MSDITFTARFTHRLRETTDVAGRDFETLRQVLAADGGRVVLWSDSHLAGDDPTAFANRLHRRLTSCSDIDYRGPFHVIPGGESSKHSEGLLRGLLDQINDHELDRRSTIIVAGGGAVLDVAGFAAAIAHRGVRLLRIPSTTLAQADSGVGVKNAINYYGKKNWLGSFAVPSAVINDAAILETLPDREFCSGFTEAVKVSLLKDVEFFTFLCEHANQIASRDQASSGHAVSRSCRLHLEHITAGGDPFEMLEARPLDFGHWSAHKLEPLTRYKLRHGEAVGIGVALDTLYSVRQFGLSMATVDSVLQTFRDLRVPLWHEAMNDAETLLEGLEEFRQHLGGRLTVTMLRGVGEPIDVHTIDTSVMKSCLNELCQRAGSKGS